MSARIVPAQTRRRPWPAILFWLVAAVPISVVLAVPQLVLQDGGLHLSNAVALTGLLGDWWPHVLAWRPALTPNLTVELSLMGLVQIVGPDTALRIVTIIGLLGFAVVIAVLMRTLRLPLYAGIPLLAFQMHFLVMMGFVGFVWAVPLGLAAVVVALRRPERPAAFPLGFLLAATWFTHIVPAIVATIVAAVIVLCAHRGPGKSWGRSLGAAAQYVGVPAAPVIVLSAFWLTSTGSAAPGSTPGVAYAAKGLLEFSAPLVAYAHVEYWVARLVALTCVVAALCAVVHRRRHHQGITSRDGVLGASLLVAALAVIMPENSASGAGFIATRLALLAAVLLMLWVAIQRPRPAGNVANHSTPLPGIGYRVSWWTALVVAGVAAVALPLVRIPALTHLSGQLEQIRSVAPCLPRRSTFIQFNLDNAGDRSARGMSPMAEQTGHLAVERDALDLGNESGWYPFYLWRYHSSARADLALRLTGSIDAVPPDVYLSSALTHQLPLDAVVLYGRTSANRDTLTHPHTLRLQEDLERDFQLARRSDSGDAELWLRRDLTPAC